MSRPQTSKDDFSLSGLYCPNCWGKLQFQPRSGLMKLFPNSTHYRCIQCKKRFLQILRRLIELQNVHWYLVMSKPRQEDRALKNLTRQGYPCFLPKVGVERIRNGKIQINQEPLFPRYVFIQLSSSEHNWGPIRSTLGVTTLVRFGIEFAKVPTSVIESIQSFASAHKELAFEQGERILIKSGPFKGIEAEFRNLDGDARAIVLVELLHKIQMLPLVVSTRPLEPTPN